MRRDKYCVPGILKNCSEILITIVFSILILLFFKLSVAAQSVTKAPERAPEGLRTEAVALGLHPDGSREISGFQPSAIKVTTFKEREKAPIKATTTLNSSPPSPRAEDPVSLLVDKTWNSTTGAWDLDLSWSGSGGPFTLSYSTDPSFQLLVKTLERNTDLYGKTCGEDTGQTLECYSVTDEAVTSVAVQGIGYNPEPSPEVPGLSANGLWWGDDITLSGNYMDPIPSENLACFWDRYAKAKTVGTGTNGYATSATFTIPTDTQSTFMEVEAHGRPSDIGTSNLLNLYAAGIGPVTNIRCVSYDPNEGHIWIAADSKVEEIDLFEKTPCVISTLTGYTKPYISRVTTGGKLLVVDGVSGVSTIDQIDVTTWSNPPPVSLYANTTDTSHTPNFTRAILPVGIGVDPDGTSCYIADDNVNGLVKFPYNNTSAVQDEWGGFTNWNFPDPCGIDSDPGHQVYAGSTNGYILYVPSGGGSTWVNGYTNETPKAIEVDQDMSVAGDSYITYSDQGFAEAVNKNPIEEVTGTPIRYHAGQVWASYDGHLMLSPDWNYLIGHHFPQRVVINNNGSSVAYHSPYQHQDRIVEMSVNGWPYRSLILKVIDPPDLSAYAPDSGEGWCGTSDYHSCTAAPPYEGKDNIGAVDYGLTTDPNGENPAPDQSIQLDFGENEWSKTFYLKIPTRYSGDNWQVEVHKVSRSTGLEVPNKVMNLSGVYTSWKRVLVERDHMFRRGGILAGDASKDADVIYLAKTYDNDLHKWVRADNVEINDRIAIFDNYNTFEGTHDEACVVGMANQDDDQQARVTILLGTPSSCEGGYTLNNDYSASVTTEGVWDFSTGRSAGVGVIADSSGVPYDTSSNQINSTNSAFYDADMRDIEQPFDDAYVEFIALRDGMGAVPYLSQSYFDIGGTNGLAYFSQAWFKNFQPAADSPPHANVAHNYIHLFGVSAMASKAGLCNSTFDWSYIFQQNIEGTNWNQTEKHNYTRATTDYELGHQFDPNFCSDLVTCKTPPEPPTWGAHDYRSWWGATTTDCPNSNPCLMDPDAGNPTDTVNRFCTDDLLLGDPNDVYPCPTSGGTIYRVDTAVRTCSDPR